jgi:hypothetical protein
MAGAGCLRHRTTDLAANQRVGNQALARVRATADGGHQEWLPVELRLQFAEEGAVPSGVSWIDDAECAAEWLERLEARAQFSDAATPRGERRGSRGAITGRTDVVHGQYSQLMPGGCACLPAGTKSPKLL